MIFKKTTLMNSKPSLYDSVGENPTPALSGILTFMGILILVLLALSYAPQILSGGLFEGPFYRSLTYILAGISIGLFAFILITIGWTIKALNSIVIATEYQAKLISYKETQQESNQDQ